MSTKCHLHGWTVPLSDEVEPLSDEVVPLSAESVLLVSVFPLEVGSVPEVPDVEPSLETGVPVVELLPTPAVEFPAPTVELSAVELPAVELPEVEFPTVELPLVALPAPADELPVELDELETEAPLQILQEFSRMTAPNLVLIHSAIVSNW